MTTEARPGMALSATPRKEHSGPRASGAAAPFPVQAAALSTEDDFELGQAFVDVFVRTGERLWGFLAGCIVVAGLWALWAAL